MSETSLFADAANLLPFNLSCGAVTNAKYADPAEVRSNRPQEGSESPTTDLQAQPTANQSLVLLAALSFEQSDIAGAPFCRVDGALRVQREHENCDSLAQNFGS